MAFLRRRRPPRVAAVTMVRDEADLLPRWLGYYGAQLGEENLVVIDDHSTDGSTDGLAVEVIRDPELEEGNFERSRMRCVSAVASRLLASHDAVLFTDCDELLVPDPLQADGLVDYVARHRGVPVMAGLGFNLVHRIDLAGTDGAEAPLDPSAPVLDQRRDGFFIPRLCKPSMKRVDAGWRFASHGINARFRPSPDLLMIHLKYADADLLRRTGDRRKAVHASTGLGPRSAWASTGQEQVDQLGAMLAGRPGPTLFDPSAVALDTLVRQRGEAWETDGARETTSMREGDLVRLPDRFRGLA